MRSRSVALSVSILIAALAYYGLYLAAPRILIFQPDAAAAALLKRYPVKLVDNVPEQRTSARLPDTSGLSSRPGTVRDLLTRDPDEQAEVSIPDPGADLLATDTPQTGADALAQDYDLTQSADHLKRMEAKVLAIESDAARREVEVSRRLVRQGPDEALQEDVNPVLRGPAADAPRALDIAIPASNLMEDSLPGEEAPRPEAAQIEPPSVLAPLDTPEFPGLEVAAREARGTVEKEQARAREESAYTFLDDLVDVELTTWPGRPGEDAFFRVRILPKGEGAFKPLPKIVYYVIDASSSIHPRKLTLSARGVADALGQLREGDRFNVVVFRDSPRFLSQQPVAPTKENLAAARAFLSGLEPKGETDVFQALQPVLQTPLEDGTAGVVIVLSDGRPTTGMQDGRAIINSLTAENRYGYGIYAFGGGNTVNRPLLDMLAYRNAGTVQVTDDMGAMQNALPPFTAQFEAPLLTRCRAVYAGSGVGSVYPEQLPDFFRGRAVTLYGRYDPAGAESFVMRLTGRTQTGPQEIVFRADLKKAERGSEAMMKSWAVQKAYYLVGRISAEGEDPYLMTALRVLRERYDVRTSYHP